jgi:hypothetical protein
MNSIIFVCVFILINGDFSKLVCVWWWVFNYYFFCILLALPTTQGKYIVKYLNFHNSSFALREYILFHVNGKATLWQHPPCFSLWLVLGHLWSVWDLVRGSASGTNFINKDKVGKGVTTQLSFVHLFVLDIWVLSYLGKGGEIWIGFCFNKKILKRIMHLNISPKKKL